MKLGAKARVYGNKEEGPSLFLQMCLFQGAWGEFSHKIPKGSIN